MISVRNIPLWVFKLALVASAAVWGGSFVVIKSTLDDVGPCWLMFLRFLLATIIIAITFRRRLAAVTNRDHLIAGAALGIVYGSAFVFQNLGLVQMSPGRNAFLTAPYCVVVPLIMWALTLRRPGIQSLVAAVLAVIGVGLISLDDELTLSLAAGEVLTLLAAVLYAVHIVLVSRLSRGRDIMVLTVVQLGVAALVCLPFALVLEVAPNIETLSKTSTVLSLAYQVLLSGCVCMVLQNVAQTRVPPAQASLLLALESVFAVAASVAFYGEVVTPRLAVGFVTIFVAVILSEIGGVWGERRTRRLEERVGEGLGEQEVLFDGEARAS